MILEEIKSAFVENKTALLLAVAIFFFFFFLGFLLNPYLHDLLNPVVEDLTQKVKQGVIKLTFKSLFMNNIRIVFLMFVLGVFFCFSAAILAFNGFFTGYYVATTDNLFESAMLIIPHGIFEFSSCIIACAAGFVLFSFLVRFLKTFIKQHDVPIREMIAISFDASSDKLKQAIILLVVASILMAIAGFVEAYLTIHIAELIMPISS